MRHGNSTYNLCSIRPNLFLEHRGSGFDEQPTSFFSAIIRMVIKSKPRPIGIFTVYVVQVIKKKINKSNKSEAGIYAKKKRGTFRVITVAIGNSLFLSILIIMSRLSLK
jgi:hypothetical protein